MRGSTWALLALFLNIIPASEAAAAQSHSSHRSLLRGGLGTSWPSQLRVLAELERSIPADALDSVQRLGGYALADKLDEIGRAPQTIEFVIRCSQIVLDSSLVELAKTLSEPELRAAVDPSLAEKIDRLAALLDESFSVIVVLLTQHGREEREAAMSELASQSIGQIVQSIDDRSLPVAERRLLRHWLRGMSAMFCLAGRPTSVDLQAALLHHAIVGYESMLRMIAGTAGEPQRERIIALGLEPVDRDALDRRAEQLDAAREALEEAEAAFPGFRLPPDPAFLKEPQD